MAGDGRGDGAGLRGDVGAVAAHPLRVASDGLAGGDDGLAGGGGGEVVVAHGGVGVFAVEVLLGRGGGGREDGDGHGGWGIWPGVKTIIGSNRSWVSGGVIPVFVPGVSW